MSIWKDECKFSVVKIAVHSGVNVSDLRCQLFFFKNASVNFFPAEVTHSIDNNEGNTASLAIALVCYSRLSQEKRVLWPKYHKHVKSAKKTKYIMYMLSRPSLPQYPQLFGA